MPRPPDRIVGRFEAVDRKLNPVAPAGAAEISGLLARDQNAVAVNAEPHPVCPDPFQQEQQVRAAERFSAENVDPEDLLPAELIQKPEPLRRREIGFPIPGKLAIVAERAIQVAPAGYIQNGFVGGRTAVH